MVTYILKMQSTLLDLSQEVCVLREGGKRLPGTWAVCERGPVVPSFKWRQRYQMRQHKRNEDAEEMKRFWKQVKEGMVTATPPKPLRIKTEAPISQELDMTPYSRAKS
eukprot:NODE_1241_length_1219_cov_65.815385_g1014_i0.p2 GENE.NODE_1241_length_1219_cov_65.815385_g1014_i0~~NODE_1241_length_1219_cov_65.815385_g1014_i0.p2  ORF type:complete len:108 (+),score=13.92 NODE_1241_length_1219_cov_65.815385_g1014_i0:864-1187(+)